MKKLTAVVTTIVITISILCQTVTFAAFSDVTDDNSYKNAITTLSKLSVIDGYEDGTFKPDNPVTRAEFTKLIVSLLGYQDMTHETIDFSDVDTSHWAKNYIQTAFNLGIINGMGDGTFAPESPVTYEQALKMIVCTLGYDTFAMQNGGWPSGYIYQAASLGITKNIDASYNQNATRGVIAQSLYNALEIEMYENTGFGWNKTDKTLLNDYLQVKELKGILTGVGDYVTEDCKRDLLEGEMAIMSNSGEEVIINYLSYTQNISDISKYLGNTITVYYKQPTENSEKALVIIDDETSKNTEYEINSSDLNNFSGNTLKYYESATKSKSLKIKDDVTIRYNGMIVTSEEPVTLTDPVTNSENSYSRQEALELWLNHDTDYTIYGTVKATDSGNDGTVDMLQIYDYETMVAYSAPTSSDYRITDKLVTGNYLILDPQSAEYTYTITKNDKEIPVTSIATNDVILYAKSLDGSLYTLIVTNQTVKGTISSINSDGTRITISDKQYELGEKCASYISEKDGKELKAGLSGTFYLDAFNTAVFGSLEQTAVLPYGYITNAFIDYDEGGKVYITAYMQNVSGEAASYPLKDRIKLNGSSINSDLAMEKLADTASYTNGDTEFSDQIYGNGKTPSLTGYSQPARIKITNGEVTEIITATSDEVQNENIDKEQLVKCKDLDAYTYTSNSFSQDGKTSFAVNSSTIVLCIPGDRTDNKKYAKKTPSSAFTTGETFYVEAYDINASKVAGLIIMYGSDGSLNKVKKDSNYSVVASLPESTYNESTDSTSLKFDVFAASNTTKSWTTYDDTEFKDIAVGDVIQFAYDSDNLAQGRINCIKFSDIAAVLDGEEYNGQKYSWAEEQTPSEENNFQEYKFDYRFKKTGTDEDEIYSNSSLGTTEPYSRACMYNVSQVLLDDKKLYVTKDGFTAGEDGTLVLDDSNYEEVTITSATKIVRMEDTRDEISRYASGTTTDMSINDLKDAKNFGAGCSKVLICKTKGVARLIVVYN